MNVGTMDGINVSKYPTLQCRPKFNLRYICNLDAAPKMVEPTGTLGSAGSGFLLACCAWPHAPTCVLGNDWHILSFSTCHTPGLTEGLLMCCSPDIKKDTLFADRLLSYAYAWAITL